MSLSETSGILSSAYLCNCVNSVILICLWIQLLILDSVHRLLNNCFLIVQSMIVLLMLPAAGAVYQSIFLSPEAGIAQFDKETSFIGTQVMFCIQKNTSLLKNVLQFLD